MRNLIKKILKEEQDDIEWVGDIKPFSEVEEFIYNLLSGSKIEQGTEKKHYLEDKETFIKSQDGNILLTIEPPHTDDYYYRVGSPNQIRHKKPILKISSRNILKPLEKMGIEWNESYHRASTEYLGGYKIPKGRSRKSYKERYGIDILKDVIKNTLNIDMDKFSVMIGQ